MALPLARPALAAGALAAMEALADFGAVNLLNYRALTDAIYRVWYGAFDRQAALQLGTILLALVLLLLALERLAPRAARATPARARGGVVPRRLRGWRAVAARSAGVAAARRVVAPLAQLVTWSVAAVGDGTFAARSAPTRATACCSLPGRGSSAVSRRRSPTARGAPRARRRRRARGGLGYAVPGSVAAAAVCSLRRSTAVDARRARPLLTGTLARSPARLRRALHRARAAAVEARLAAVPTRSTPRAHPRRRPPPLLAEVHLPLLCPGVATAALLVFVEVLKELPATVLLRPLGLDTLAIAVWEATKDSRYETAAFPALLIVAVGLVPVVLAIRLVRAPGPG